MRNYGDGREFHMGVFTERRLSDEGRCRAASLKTRSLEHPITRGKNVFDVVVDASKEDRLAYEGLRADSLGGEAFEQSAVNRLRLPSRIRISVTGPAQKK